MILPVSEHCDLNTSISLLVAEHPISNECTIREDSEHSSAVDPTAAPEPPPAPLFEVCDGFELTESSTPI